MSDNTKNPSDEQLDDVSGGVGTRPHDPLDPGRPRPLPPIEHRGGGSNPQ